MKADFEIRRATCEAISACFWYKGPLREFLRECGLALEVIDEYERQYQTKGRFLPPLLEKLNDGNDRSRTVMWRIIQGVSQLNGAQDDDRDNAKAVESINRLRNLLHSHDIEFAKARSSPQRPIETVREDHRKTSQKFQTLEAVRLRFHALCKDESSPQARGIEFQDLLRQLFQCNDIPYEPPARSPGQEIDGLFMMGSRSFIVEARWRKEKAEYADLAHFQGKVQNRLEGTLGFFVSMSGFTPNAVDLLLQTGRKNIILVDGIQTAYLFQSGVDIREVLLKSIRAAERTGEIRAQFRE